jgi:quinol monooxygenase YgiN
MRETLTRALFVRLEAKPGKAAELEAFLRAGLEMAQGEPLTLLWFALRISDSVFAIFDAFADDEGRDAHLSGPIAQALMQKADELLAKPPTIERLDIFASKVKIGATTV